MKELMYLDSEGLAARGLRRYVRLVADAIGVGAAASTLQLEEPVSVYLPLDRCSSAYPEHDLALLWDERYGWALAQEVPGSAQVTILGYLLAGRLPSPRVVAEYVDAACAGRGFGGPRPLADFDDLTERLAGYAERVRVSWRFGAHTPSRAVDRLSTVD